MKKMLTLFFSGCALVGLGLGVFFVELREWKVSDFREDLKELPRQTYIQTIYFNSSQPTHIEMAHAYSYRNLNFDVKVVKDATCTDNLRIETVYHGTEPYLHRSISGENNEYYHLYFNTRNLSGTAYYDLIKSMFDNKTYYEHENTSHIDSVTLYTATPENITFQGINDVVIFDQTDTVA